MTTIATSTAPFPAAAAPLSKRRKVVHDTLFPTFYLPQTAVAQVIEYLDVATRVKTTRCNKAWRNEIFGDHHSHLWKVIDFDDANDDSVRRTNALLASLTKNNGERETKETMMITTTVCPSPPQEDTTSKDEKPASRITDQQLGALLRNCRAADRCEVLKLHGCLQIKGNGLEPLRGSRVLREIDLRLVPPIQQGQQASPDIIMKGTDSSSSHPPKVDPSIVIPILSSMPPFAPVLAVPTTTAAATTSLACLPCTSSSSSAGLSLVKFDIVNDTTTNYYSRFVNEAGDFLYNFHQALRRQAEQNNPSHSCGYCKGNVLDGKSEDCKQWIMGTSYCEACQNFSCGNGTCPSPWNCVDCLVQCCQPMGPGSTCKGQQEQQSSSSSCHPHNQNKNKNKVIYMCKSCDRLQCEDCFEGLLCANDDCCNEYCTDDAKDCLSNLSSCDICHSDEEFKFYCPGCIDDHKRYYCPGGCRTATATTTTTN